MKFIAELCQNHMGKTHNVEKALEKCAENGADIVKLQYINSKNLSFRARFENGLIVNQKIYSIKRPYKKEFNRLKRLDLPKNFYSKFIKICDKHGVKPLITCFTKQDIKEIYDMGYEDIKVASYDCSSFSFLNNIKKNFKKIYVSTGATYDHEIERAAEILKNLNYIFLHCVTIYPTPLNKINFARINFLKKFSKKVGFSDHSLAINQNKNLACELAIFFGAEYLERHIRLFSSEKTKDGVVSILPEDIKNLKNFSKLSKNDMKLYFRENYKLNVKKYFGKEKRELTDIELLNRDYYKGRFVSKFFTRDEVIEVFNWEDLYN